MATFALLQQWRRSEEDIIERQAEEQDLRKTIYVRIS
ncbi:hypothetical protein L916_16816 [Phytophthora nicotianae]|uniref:Uncharacterized protein n=1 Tax=Phytophthora nicotianae TaxID=4792 RepID=W2I7R7_PHYNI|nr:hypothetical protein L916_16816 [Phytophthora nicotianae]